MKYSEAHIVKDLFQAGLLTKDEARSELGISCDTPQPYSVTFTGVAGLGTTTLNMPPKPKPTRGEEIVADAITARHEHVVLRYPTVNDAGAANYLLPRYMAADAAADAAKHIRKCIADLIDKAIAEEREACAKVAERMSAMAYDKVAEGMAVAIAERIRDGKVA